MTTINRIARGENNVVVSPSGRRLWTQSGLLSFANRNGKRGEDSSRMTFMRAVSQLNPCLHTTYRNMTDNAVTNFREVSV